MTPDLIREFLADYLHQSDDWFQGFVQGLLLTEMVDTYQIERIEEWWLDQRSLDHLPE
jgi:hypothetical protein